MKTKDKGYIDRTATVNSNRKGNKVVNVYREGYLGKVEVKEKIKIHKDE